MKNATTPLYERLDRLEEAVDQVQLKLDELAALIATWAGAVPA
jgi:tetrahydromethanopterin S-methyltransferase subunit B